MIDEAAIRLRWDVVGSQLDERGRRLFAAAEVRTAGRGGRDRLENHGARPFDDQSRQA